MNGESESTDRQSTSAQPTPSHITQEDNAPPPTAATNEQLQAAEQKIEERMSAFERSTIRLSRVAVGVSIVVGLAVIAQSYELHKGGKDTHNLAIAAGNQADWTKDLAGHMKDQSDRTKDLSDRMKDQADQTKVIATQAKVSADAAKRAADIADQTLHLSQRAYLILGPPINDFANERINIPIYNMGHNPSGVVKIVEHMAIAKINNPTITTISLNDFIEKHWKVTSYQSIPAISPSNGSLYTLVVHLPKDVQEDIEAGKEAIYIVEAMTYNDGFPNTPDQTWLFCDNSSYRLATKLFAMRPCDNPETVLQQLTILDEYPNTEYEDK